MAVLLTGVIIEATNWDSSVGDVLASVGNGQVQDYRGGVLIQTLNTGLGGITTGSTTSRTGTRAAIRTSSRSRA